MQLLNNFQVELNFLLYLTVDVVGSFSFLGGDQIKHIPSVESPGRLLGKQWLLWFLGPSLLKLLWVCFFHLLVALRQLMQTCSASHHVVCSKLKISKEVPGPLVPRSSFGREQSDLVLRKTSSTEASKPVLKFQKKKFKQESLQYL